MALPTSSGSLAVACSVRIPRRRRAGRQNLVGLPAALAVATGTLSPVVYPCSQASLMWSIGADGLRFVRYIFIFYHSLSFFIKFILYHPHPLSSFLTFIRYHPHPHPHRPHHPFDFPHIHHPHHHQYQARCAGRARCAGIIPGTFDPAFSGEPGRRTTPRPPGKTLRLGQFQQKSPQNAKKSQAIVQSGGKNARNFLQNEFNINSIFQDFPGIL